MRLLRGGIINTMSDYNGGVPIVPSSLATESTAVVGFRFKV